MNLFSALLASAALATEKVGIDFFLVQDVSFSYENDLPYLHDQIPKILTYLAAEFGDAAFGMSTFVDKPLDNFGYQISGDYCYDLTMPLTPITVVTTEVDGQTITEGVLSDGKSTQLDELLSEQETYSGRDWPENQLGALLHTLKSVNSQWSGTRQPFVALATDSGFHQRGDAKSLKNTPGIYAENPDQWCLTEDYPSVEEIREALEESGTRMLFLVTPDMVGYYTEFLDALGPELGFVVGLRQRSAYIAEAVQTGLHFMSKKGYGFGSTATLKFTELLAAEAILAQEEAALNRSAPAAPAPIDGIDEEDIAAFGPKKKMYDIVVKTEHDLTGINSTAAPSTPDQSSVSADDEAHDAQGVMDSESGLKSVADLIENAVSSALFKNGITRTSRTIKNASPLLECGEDVVFEIVLVQDASESFESDRDLIAQNIPHAFRSLQDSYPGSRFGLTAFVDKPIEPFGYSSANDYCSSMRVGLTEDVDEVETSLQNLIIRSGNDWKEAQLHGLMHTAFTRMADWSDVLTDEQGRKIVRVAALTTDAGYHEAGDSDLPPNNGDRYQDCENEDYPSVDQVGDALRGQQIYPLFLVTDNVRTEYENLLYRMRTNGAVRVMGTTDNLIGNLEESLMSGLQSICNYISVTPTGELSKPPALSITDNDEVIELDLNQRPKFLSVVTKK